MREDVAFLAVQIGDLEDECSTSEWFIMGFEGAPGSFIVFVMFECIFLSELICCCTPTILLIIGMPELFGRCILAGVREAGVYHMKIISKS